MLRSGAITGVRVMAVAFAATARDTAVGVVGRASGRGRRAGAVSAALLPGPPYRPVCSFLSVIFLVLLIIHVAVHERRLAGQVLAFAKTRRGTRTGYGGPGLGLWPDAARKTRHNQSRLTGCHWILP